LAGPERRSGRSSVPPDSAVSHYSPSRARKNSAEVTYPIIGPLPRCANDLVVVELNTIADESSNVYSTSAWRLSRMRPSRRHFLQETALSILAAQIPFSAFAQKISGNQGKEFDPENLAIFDRVSAQTFEPWIGSNFRIRLNNKPMGVLVLDSVNVLDTPTATASATTPPAHRVLSMHEPPKTPITTSFSLLFRRSGAALPQDTYMLDHDWLGTFPLLLVPSGEITNPSTCTATFTLLSVTALAH
jgi:hypothetical protein